MFMGVSSLGHESSLAVAVSVDLWVQLVLEGAATSAGVGASG